MGIFTTDDPDYSQDADVKAAQARIAELQKHDVTKGTGLSEGALTLANQIGGRNTTAEDLTQGVNESKGLIDPNQSRSFNQSLGMGQDQHLTTALQNRANRNFERQSGRLKTQAGLKAQQLKAQDLSTAQKATMAQQKFGIQNKARTEAMDYANKQQRNAVLGAVLGGAGAVAGTIIAPGAGTAAGAQMGSSAAGAMG